MLNSRFYHSVPNAQWIIPVLDKPSQNGFHHSVTASTENEELVHALRCLLQPLLKRLRLRPRSLHLHAHLGLGNNMHILRVFSFGSNS